MSAPAPHPPERCVQATPAWSGAAALATVSAHHGVPLEVRELAELTHTGELPEIAEGTVLVLARALGFEAVAMEGGYGDLPDVVLPMLVAFREKETDRYAVLFAFDDAQATVGDPVTGEVGAWTRERFCAVWTGSVVQVTPIADERRTLERRLVEARDGVRRALRSVGWAPPYGPRYAMLAAWGVVVATAVAAPRAVGLDATWIPLVAAACMGALWSWLAGDSCARCSRAQQLAGGLPVAQAGVAVYAALLVTPFVNVPPAAIALVLGGAVGAHGALVATLARAKMACGPCFFVGACALGAGMVSLARENAHPAVFGAALGAMLVGVLALLPRARAREASIWRAAAEALGRATLAEPRAEGDTTVRVVAYKRSGCAGCAFFEAAVKPALLATFAEGLALEERDIGRARTVAPVIVVDGGKRTLFVGLPLDDAPGKLIQTVREAIGAPPSKDAPMTVVSEG